MTTSLPRGWFVFTIAATLLLASCSNSNDSKQPNKKNRESRLVEKKQASGMTAQANSNTPLQTAKKQPLVEPKRIQFIPPVIMEDEPIVELSNNWNATVVDNSYNNVEGEYDVEPASSTPDVPKNREIYTFVDEGPEFPGGLTPMREFIAKNFVYPAQLNEEIKGKVYIRFVVETDGSFSGFQVLRGLHPLIDREALRVIQVMPNWIPGKKDGEKVPAYFVIPIAVV